MRKLLPTLLLVSSALHAAEIPKHEDYTLLLNSQAVNRLDQIQSLNLNQGLTKKSLWSGSYWPFYQGSLGARYRDPQFKAVMDRTYKYEEYVTLRGARVHPNDLSPAEKYDLLLGDSVQTFTETQWKNGDENRSLGGSVPTWRGICDGWAAASMTWNRPAKAVTLLSVNGQAITFYPEDIKALGSQLHAKGFKTVTFLGKRCNGTTGWLTGACKGLNPAALHLALTNSVGKDVIDNSKELNEYRIGRPSVALIKDTEVMFFTSGSRTGEDYFPSMAVRGSNGEWARDKYLFPLKLSEIGWDSKHLCYPRLISVQDKNWLFYNGNNMGFEGFGVAEVSEWIKSKF
jgi:hypothetical protein